MGGAEPEAEAEYDDGLMGIENLLTVYMPSAPTVVMTGSHTFAGELMEDGVFGLPRAWLASGAKSVVSHLWASPDEATKLLMMASTATAWGDSLAKQLHSGKPSWSCVSWKRANGSTLCSGPGCCSLGSVLRMIVNLFL